jgi:lipoic acid synthetase
VKDVTDDLQVPDWLKNRGKTFSKTFNVVRSTVNSSSIATVCEEASCPNRTECWSGGTATFMLMGDTCTRACMFCAVKTTRNPPPLDRDEPDKFARALDDWDLNYIVVTSVDRDDLDDGGASHLARCIRSTKQKHPHIRIEILIPDFKGSKNSIAQIVQAKPEVIAHNIETVRRLTPKVRDRRAGYDQSLKVLSYLKELDQEVLTKSSIMVGLSETKEEVIQTMQDLRAVDVDFLTIGQYMRPSLKQLPVKRYISQELFNEYERIGHEMDFRYVVSKPLVRSSYRAGEFFINQIISKKRL